MVLMIAKVNPSHKSLENTNQPWLIAKHDGEIVAAHCTCMAG